MFRSKLVRPSTKVLDAAEGRIQAIVSTEAEDREGDVIRASGWVLDSFQRHPVLLSSHDYRSLRSQIGEWTSMEIRGKRLVGEARYYIGEGNPEADWGFQLASKGRAAYSVGFVPLEFEEREASAGREGLFGNYEFRRQELLEVSHVTVPANADALQLVMRSGPHPLIEALVTELLAEQSPLADGPQAPDAGLDLEALAEALAPLLVAKLAALGTVEQITSIPIRRTGQPAPEQAFDPSILLTVYRDLRMEVTSR